MVALKALGGQVLLGLPPDCRAPNVPLLPWFLQRHTYMVSPQEGRRTALPPPLLRDEKVPQFRDGSRIQEYHGFAVAQSWLLLIPWLCACGLGLMIASFILAQSGAWQLLALWMFVSLPTLWIAYVWRLNYVTLVTRKGLQPLKHLYKPTGRFVQGADINFTQALYPAGIRWQQITEQSGYIRGSVGFLPRLVVAQCFKYFELGHVIVAVEGGPNVEMRWVRYPREIANLIAELQVLLESTQTAEDERDARLRETIEEGNRELWYLLREILTELRRR